MRLSASSLVRLLTIALSVAVAGLLAGCGNDGDTKNSPAETKPVDSTVAKSASSGSIQIGDRTITFRPDVCITSGEDSLVSGPGKDADAAPGSGDFPVTPNADGIAATGEFTDGNNNPVGTGTMVVTCK